MNKIKVCMLVTNSLIKDPRVQRETISAHRNGFEVVLIGMQDAFYNKDFLENQPFTIDIIKYGDKMSSSRNFFVKVYRMIYRFWSFVFKSARYKPDIIHCNDLNTLLQGYIAAKFCCAKVVYDSHEVNCDLGAINLNRKQKRDMKREKLLISRVDRVISVSNAASKLIGDYYNIDKPTIVTNCSFKTEGIDFSIRKNSFKVLYHGIISRDRGYEEFVEACGKVDGAVVMQIRGYGPIERQLREMAKDRKLKNLVFEEPVEIIQLIPKAAESSVGVVLTKPVSTNFKYTVGNKLFEYVNAGLPVILSDIPEHRYLNEKFNIGIVIEVTPDNISNTVNLLYNNKQKYNELRENAIKMSKVMCWENEVEKLLEVYRELGSIK